MNNLLIGKRYLGELQEALKYHGFHPIGVPDNPNVDPRLAGHIDLSILDAGKIMILSKYLREENTIVKQLTNNGIQIIFAQDEQSASYPQDAGLCACKVGTWVIHNIKCCDQAILSHFSDCLISVRQGYARCAVCVVDSSSIITADRGITAAAKKNGIDVLLIEPGGFELEGFREGFIGGSSFRFENKLYFTGSLDRHPGKSKILGFLSQKALDVVYLTDRPAFDIGSAVPIRFPD